MIRDAKELLLLLLHASVLSLFYWLFPVLLAGQPLNRLNLSDWRDPSASRKAVAPTSRWTCWSSSGRISPKSASGTDRWDSTLPIPWLFTKAARPTSLSSSWPTRYVNNKWQLCYGSSYYTCGGWVQRIRSSRNLRKIRQPFRDWTLCLRDGQSEGKDLLHPTHDWVIRMTTTSLFLFRERERERESSQDHEDGRENHAGEILITDRRVPLLFHETFSPFSLFYTTDAQGRGQEKKIVFDAIEITSIGEKPIMREREEERYRKRKESETLTVCLRGFYKVRWLSYSNGYSLWGAESDQKIRFICMRGLESGELGNKRRYLMLDIFPFSFLSLGLYAVWLRDWCDAHQEMPYVMVRSERNLTGNDRYEGFCIDLLKAIAGIMIVPIYYL